MSGLAVELPRLLHQRSECGYTAEPHQALSDEPEAVSEAEQRSLTRQAHRAKAARDRFALCSATAVIELELEALELARVEPNLSADIRAIRRTLDKMRRQLGT